MISFWLNDKLVQTNLPPGTLVLDFVRYEKNLKGTKIGCREGDCGACTVLVGSLQGGELEYRNHTSCLMPIGNAAGKHIVTVEGINQAELNPIQQAIVDEGGTQCGFCTVGFVMSLVGFSLQSENHQFRDGIASIDGNICRCTGYKSLERAVGIITRQLESSGNENRLDWLVENKFLPAYFKEIKERLQKLVSSSSGSLEGQKIKMGGGTDLYVQKHDQMVQADIRFVFDQPELNGIKKEGNKIVIGGAATVSDLLHSGEMKACFPGLGTYLKLVSSTPIRNMATLAGNFVNASPIGDMSIFFLAIGARIKLTAMGHSRTILLKDLFSGYKTLTKTQEEEISSIEFDIPEKEWHFNFEKVSKRTHLDIASVNSAISLEMNGNLILKAGVSTGGVFAFPRYLSATSEFLSGRELNYGNILKAAEILQSEIAPISDARGTETYKRLLARQLFFAHFLRLFPEQISSQRLIPVLQ